MPVLIGTSGWLYRDWKPLLYPDVPQRCWLERHAEAFATVEVNNAFPAGTRVAVEPRHDSWWDPSVRAVLPRRCGACPRSNVDARAAPAQMRTFSSGK